MSDQNAALARRLSAKRWPNIACAAALAGGLSTAALLILAAGKSHVGPDVATLIAAGTLKVPASHVTRISASSDSHASSRMRGTVKVADVVGGKPVRNVAGLQ